MKKKIDNTIGDKGAKAISELLMINTTLTSLDLTSDEKIKIGKDKEMKRMKNE